MYYALSAERGPSVARGYGLACGGTGRARGWRRPRVIVAYVIAGAGIVARVIGAWLPVWFARRGRRRS